MSNNNGASDKEDRVDSAGPDDLLTTFNVKSGETVELTEDEERALPLFEFNQPILPIEFTDSGEEYCIELRRARKDELHQREYISRTIKTTKKVGENQHITTVTNY